MLLVQHHYLMRCPLPDAPHKDSFQNNVFALLPHYVKSPIFVQKVDFDKTYFVFICKIQPTPI